MPTSTRCAVTASSNYRTIIEFITNRGFNTGTVYLLKGSNCSNSYTVPRDNNTGGVLGTGFTCLIRTVNGTSNATLTIDAATLYRDVASAPIVAR